MVPVVRSHNPLTVVVLDILAITLDYWMAICIALWTRSCTALYQHSLQHHHSHWA